MTWNSEFESAFHPRSVAVVGISSESKRSPWWTTAYYITGFEELGFTGHLYLVHPRAGEILGYKAYPSVASIPEPLDLVIISVPGQELISVLEDCIKANAKNIHIYTSGFEETGEPAGRELGEQVRRIAARGGLRIIGPNCMGLYAPSGAIGAFGTLSRKIGPVSFVSQSGVYCNWFAHYGPDCGIYFSKVISYGNAYVLDSTDFLEYLSTDPETGIICMYTEGVKDGRKLLRLVKEINRRKPVIIFKAGLTAAGSRAAVSHTGSLAGEEAIWQAFFAQTGAVQVFSMEEMLETTMTFLHVKPPKGNRVAMITLGGGSSVASADMCNREGLEVPTLSQSTQNALKEFIPLSGFGVRNPLDAGIVFSDISLMRRAVDLVASDPAIDMLIIMPHMDMVRSTGQDNLDKMINYLSDIAIHNPNGKPVALVFQSLYNDPAETALRARLKIELPQKGIAVYDTLSVASRALARFYRYHRRKQDSSR